MAVSNQQAFVNLHNDYAKLPRSSGDGMESKSLSNDKNLGGTQNDKTTDSGDKILLVRPRISSSTGHKNSGQVDGGVPEERSQSSNPLQNAVNRTLPQIQSELPSQIPQQQISSGNTYKSDVGIKGNITGVSSLSLERKAECLDLQSLVKDLETRNQKLAEENEKLLNKLAVQSKVNADLKKLLVASVGEDMEARLEEMATDKAKFDTTLQTLERDLEETSEELSKVSIECDVWRSKFLASRMMTNGLTDIKTTLFVKTRNCQAALQKLLEEQSDIRQHLRATNRLLQGTHRRTNLTAYQSAKKNSWQDFQKNSIVELSHINFCLAEDICHAINPAHFYETVDTISSADEEIIPVSDLTPAEQMACQVLKDDAADTDGVYMKKIGRQYIGNSYASRFLTNNFRITFDCCDRCTGALKVV